MGPNQRRVSLQSAHWPRPTTEGGQEQGSGTVDSHQPREAAMVPRSCLVNVSHLTARATVGSVWEVGHKQMPHSSSQMKNNFQATRRQKWSAFLSQQGREGRENHKKNPEKLGQFTNLSRCLQRLARAPRTNSLFFLISTTTISNLLQLIWVLGKRNTSQLSSEDEELHVSSPSSKASVTFHGKKEYSEKLSH